MAVYPETVEVCRVWPCMVPPPWGFHQHRVPGRPVTMATLHPYGISPWPDIMMFFLGLFWFLLFYIFFPSSSRAVASIKPISLLMSEASTGGARRCRSCNQNKNKGEERGLHLHARHASTTEETAWGSRDEGLCRRWTGVVLNG